MDMQDKVLYSLYKKDIISELSDRDVFVDYMIHNYYFISERLNFETEMSARRLGEAYDLWREDVTRTLAEGIRRKTVKLDHFKHAAFMTFWLRRMNPINSVRACSSDYWAKTTEGRDRQNLFLRYSNEICAINIGMQICINYESAKIFSNGVSVASGVGKRIDYLRSISLPTDLVEDFSMILKYKNMSPHSLYLMFKSLFTVLRPRASTTTTDSQLSR